MSRVVIVDDHPGVVSALADLLVAAGFDVAGTAARGVDAVDLVSSDPPDCAVVDYRLPDMTGGDLVALLRQAAPAAAIVVYTAEASLELVEDLLAAGVGGIVLKESPLADVLRALESVENGMAYVDSALLPVGVGRAGSPLTDRETEVLALVADGLSYGEIGSRLGIGVETARAHMKKASARLGTLSRTHAVAKALRLGWIH